MEADLNSNEPLDLQSIKGLIDTFFNTPSTPVQEELWKWFVFAVSSKGLSICDLSEDQLNQFNEQFIKLIYATYKWANLQKNAVNDLSKGGVNAY